MIKLKVVSVGQGFMLERDGGFKLACDEAESGFAGSFAADPENDVFYWLDTSANLWGARISNGKQPVNWSQRSISLPDKVAGAHGATGFTNTAPAIGSDGTVYVTLRNFANAGEQLRGCKDKAPTEECHLPGAPGAVLAINPTGQVLWGYRQEHPDGAIPYLSAINTDPLVLETGLLLYGDVNGNLHACSLETGLPATLTLSEGCGFATLASLLKPGESPGGGTRTYSQSFGVSVSPMVTAPLLVTGVNVANGDKPIHRLVGIATRPTYNLAWTTPFPTEPIQPDSTGTLRVSGEVLLEAGPGRLESLRPEGVSISWYAIPQKTWDRFENRALHPPRPEAQYLKESGLPSSLGVGEVTPITFDITPDGLPPEGLLLGVIDVERLRLYLGQWEGTFASWLASAKESWGVNCPAGASEAARIQRGDRFANALRDNFLLVPYRLEKPDLKISLIAPTNLPGDTLAQYQKAFVTVENLTSVPIVAPGVPVSLYAAWPGVVAEQPIGGQFIALGPKGSVTLAMDFQVMNCNGSGILRATVNSDKKPLEKDWSNNTATATVNVGPCSKGTPKSAPASKPTRTIIVPPDCIPDTDPKSRRLCTNYPKELDDW